MKKKYSFCGCFIVLSFLFFIYGCSSNNINSNYQSTALDKNDDQYCFAKNIGLVCPITKSETGYYFFGGIGDQYLFYTDKATLKTTILCNKPNCLHMNEKDIAKKSICNAYYGDNITMRISLIYYNSYLYATVEEMDKFTRYYKLIKISSDGTQRKDIYTFKVFPTNIIIHRGYLYYSYTDNGTIAGQEDTTTSKSGLYKISLENMNAEPELLFENNGIYANTLNLTGYGDNVYFTYLYLKDSSMQEVKGSLMVYNITSKRTSEINDNSGKYAICGNEIVYYKEDKDYICSIDGSGSKILNNVVGIPYCDDRYILTDTTSMERKKMKDSQGNLIIGALNIYDLNGKKLQSFDTKELGNLIIYGSDSEDIFIKTSKLNNDSGPVWDYWIIDKSKLANGQAVLKKYFDFTPPKQS